jgi:hypothetical protein
MSITSAVNSLSTLYMVGKAAWNVYAISNRPSISAPGSATDAYRPADWGKYGRDEDQMIYLAPNISEVEEVRIGKKKETYEVTVGYYFDAFIKEDHTSSVKVTEHPVQGGSNISDHAYNLADKLTLEVLVSDSVESIVSGQFTGSKSKSVSGKFTGSKSKSVTAYEILRSLKERRVLVSVKTRLFYYTNMIIENMSVSDDYKSANSLRCTVSLRQVMTAVVAVEYVTLKKKQAVQESNTGPKNTKATGSTIIAKIGATGSGG